MADTPPAAEEIQLLRFLDGLDSEAETSKRDVSRHWDENLRQARGDQWRDDNRPPHFMANIIRHQIRKSVGTLTETKPQIQVSAIKPNLDKAAVILYNTIKAIWDRGGTYDAIYRACQAADTFSASFVTTTYNPLINEIEVNYVDPRQVYIDPALTTEYDLGGCQYVRIDHIMALNDVRRRYPGRGALVKPDDRLSSQYQSAGRNRSVFSSILSMMPRPYRPQGGSKPGPIQRAEVREYWFRDYTANTSGGLLYPGGRHVLRSGNVILLDEKNPYWDGTFPIDMFVWDIDLDNVWGIDGIQDLRRIQEAINRLGDSFIHNALLSSNFRIIADMDALEPEQWEKLDNEPGLIIRKRPARQIEYQAPSPLDASVFTTIQAMMQMGDLLSGNNDPGGGRSSAQGSAALEGLQTPKQTTLRAIARRMESMLERVGQKLISRVLQFYTSDRVLFQLGPTQEWVAYTFVRQTLLEDDKGTALPPEEREQMFKDFRFMVTPGSSLAFTRMQRTMALLQLRTATGVAPSLRRIIQEADIGDPDEVIKEGIEESKKLPQPPPPKGKGGRQ